MHRSENTYINLFFNFLLLLFKPNPFLDKNLVGSILKFYIILQMKFSHTLRLYSNCLSSYHEDNLPCIISLFLVIINIFNLSICVMIMSFKIKKVPFLTFTWCWFTNLFPYKISAHTWRFRKLIIYRAIGVRLDS